MPGFNTAPCTMIRSNFMIYNIKKHCNDVKTKTCKLLWLVLHWLKYFWCPTCPVQSHRWCSLTYSSLTSSLLYIPSATFVMLPPASFTNSSLAMLSKSFCRCRATYQTLQYSQKHQDRSMTVLDFNFIRIFIFMFAWKVISCLKQKLTLQLSGYGWSKI